MYYCYISFYVCQTIGVFVSIVCPCVVERELWLVGCFLMFECAQTGNFLRKGCVLSACIISN